MSNKSLQTCFCGWSNMTTYQGLRTHQGKMGCTPKGMTIPESKQFHYFPKIAILPTPIQLDPFVDISKTALNSGQFMQLFVSAQIVVIVYFGVTSDHVNLYLRESTLVLEESLGRIWWKEHYADSEPFRSRGGIITFRHKTSKKIKRNWDPADVGVSFD